MARDAIPGETFVVTSPFVASGTRQCRVIASNVKSCSTRMAKSWSRLLVVAATAIVVDRMTWRTSVVSPYYTGNLFGVCPCRFLAPGTSLVRVSSRASQSKTIRVIVVIKRDYFSIIKGCFKHQSGWPHCSDFRARLLSRPGRRRRISFCGVATHTLRRSQAAFPVAVDALPVIRALETRLRQICAL